LIIVIKLIKLINLISNDIVLNAFLIMSTYKKIKKNKTNITNIINITKKRKYCCTDKTNKLQCININTKLNLLNLKNINHSKTTKKTKKHKNNKPYAIFTLMFGGDSYVPGILLLGSSIRKVMPQEYEKYIDLCCMVTKDVSKEAKDIILKIYDRVIDVEYLQIPPNLIKHKSEETKKSYAKTFTKLRIFEFTEYEKILCLDADMLVIKKELFSLFNLKTPAAIFMGSLSNNLQDRYFKNFDTNGKLFKQFQNKYCNWKGKQLHGNLIPYDKYENENTAQGLNIETSVLLITPDSKLALQRDKYIDTIRQKNIKIRGDTEMVSRMFKDKIYAIEPRFFGRWTNPDEHPELVILDLYGNEGKPWEVAIMHKFIDYKDVRYWWSFFIEIYDSTYKKYNYHVLDKIFNKIKLIQSNDKQSNDMNINTKTSELTLSVGLQSSVKNIYLYMEAGFGNKIFYLIFAIYLYNLYNKSHSHCKITILFSQSAHEASNDIKFDKIFSKSKSKVSFIYAKKYIYNELNIPSLKTINLFKSLKSLNDLPDLKELSQHTFLKDDTQYIFKYTYEMYKSFSKEDKDIFNIDKKLITDTKVLNITESNNKYAVIHIRYGDKVNIVKKYIENDKEFSERFLLYTPQYYIDMIHNIFDEDKDKDNNIKIIILSDSFDIVKKFIINNRNNNNNNNFSDIEMKNIVLLDTNWLNSFYLFYNASYIVMSCSTFSMAGAYFNHNNDNNDHNNDNNKTKSYLLLYRESENEKNKYLHKLNEEYAISPKWTIFNNKKYKKYILNYDYKLITEMIKYV